MNKLILNSIPSDGVDVKEIRMYRDCFRDLGHKEYNRFIEIMKSELKRLNKIKEELKNGN